MIVSRSHSGPGYAGCHTWFANLEAGERQTDSGGRIANSSEWPWQAIGRGNISGVVFCNGTLVALYMVLTAAHCLNNRITGKRHLPEYVTFLIGYSRGP